MTLRTIASQPTQLIQRTTLNNGIVVLVAENPTADIIAARFFSGRVAAGSNLIRLDYLI